MERGITNRDKEYKKKWADQHRHPKCRPPHFQIGDKVLLKKRMVNKWSTAHEKEHYGITEICGSIIGARRKSDGRTIQRDASKFKLFHEAGNENWRERLLRSAERHKPSTQNTREEERNEQTDNEARGEEIDPDENLHRPRREVHQQEEPQKRELPKRTRRLPAKFKDYVVETAL